jgi:hypothetical protein
MPQNLPEPGEFTKIFKRTHPTAQQGGKDLERTGEASGIFPAADATEDKREPEANMLPLTLSTPAAAPGVAEESPKPPSSAEPGEFTQYFIGGLPAKPPSGNSPPARVPTGVQRPNSTPPQPRNLVTDNSGSFTERFSRDSLPPRRSPEFGGRNQQMGPPPDLGRRPSAEPFDVKPPSERDAPSEYTALFGRGDLPPAPRQAAVKPAPAAPMMNDSPNALAGGSMPERTVPNIPTAAATPQGPSEFTVISKGRQPPPGDGSTVPEAAGVDSAAATRKMPLPVNVNINPINPMSALPHVGGGGGAHLPGISANASLHGANVSTPLGQASAHGPQIPQVPPINLAAGAAAAGGSTSKLSDQTKLILFFGVLAILAVILVVILVAKQKT